MEGYTPEIKVTNFPVAEQQTSFEYYVNQIHEMDKFIGELIQSLSERDVGRIEKDKDKLIALYEEGYQEAENCYEDLLAYLEK